MNEQDSTFDQPVAWRPTEDVINRAQLTKFIKQVGAHDFDDLYQKSIENVEWFTGEVLKFLDIRFNPPYEKLLDLSDGIQFPHWCVGGGLNITEMCLDRWQTDEMKDQPAVIWEGEEGNVETLTYSELLNQVKLCAAGLRADGFQKGDAIGIQLPMIPETVVALLAINRIGAIAVPVFSGYGAEAVASRLNAVGAKALITCNDFLRRGKRVYVSNVAFEAAKKCPSVKKVYTMDGKHRKYTLEERLEQAKKRFAEDQNLSEEEKAER